MPRGVLTTVAAVLLSTGGCYRTGGGDEAADRSPGAVSGNDTDSETGTDPRGDTDSSTCQGGTRGGNAILDEQARVADLEGYRGVAGNLTVTGSVESLDRLGCLTHIGRSLRIEGSLLRDLDGLQNVETLQTVEIQNTPVLREVRLDGLSETGALTVASNNALRRIDLPNLVSLGSELADGAVYISQNDALDSTDLSGLETAGKLWLIANPALSTIDLSVLRTLERDLYLQQCDALGILSFPRLVGMGALQLYDTRLETLALPRLEIIDNSVSINSTALTAIELPALTTVSGTFSVSANEALSTVGLPALSSVAGFFSISRNPRLTCDMDNLLAGLSVDGHVSVCDNGPDEGCGPAECL